MSVATRAIKSSSKMDAAKAIIAEVGDISGIGVSGPRIWVAIYERSKHAANERGDVVTPGGVIIPQKEGGTLAEDQFQGKVGLVLKVGILAFKEGYSAGEHNDAVAEGDWVVIRPTDGFAMLRGGVTCRLVRDIDILLKVPSPDAVF